MSEYDGKLHCELDGLESSKTDAGSSAARLGADLYVKLAARTEAPTAEAIVRLTLPTTVQGLHACMGMATEVGELTDALKRYIFYGKPVDLVNVREELGDLMWYVALLCRAYDFDLGLVLGQNIAKLKARYPDKFTEENALTRDLAKERGTLG